MFLKYVLRLLFHFVDETEYDEVIEANAELIEKKNEASRCLSVYRKFEERLPIIANFNHAALIGVQVSMNGELLHILHGAASRQIFILSPYIVGNTSSDADTQFPYIEYRFYKEDDYIKICELHSDCGSHNFQTGLYVHEDSGYGTALLEALISLAIQNGFDEQSVVIGELSFVDAKDEKKKQRRNMFYHKRGFDVKPNIAAVNGSIYSTIGRIEDSIKKKMRKCRSSEMWELWIPM